MKKEGTSVKCLIFTVILLGLFLPLQVFAEGQAETDEFGFLASCSSCHSGTPDYPVLGAREGYDNSGHKNGYEHHTKNAYYANGSGCQKCHTNEGFIEFVNTGTVEGFVEYPSQPGCFTCHAPHATGDFSTRTVEPVVLANGVTVDFGEGNLCANCHQSRRDATTTVVPTAIDAVSSHFGPHHGPEADILAGTNAYEFPGMTYKNSVHSIVVRDGCVTCHMALPEGRYSMSSEVGGHSFEIIGEVHESPKLNVAACNSCHPDIALASGTEYIDIRKKDYDLDGEIEPVQAEVQGLLDYFVNSDGTGLLQTNDPPFYNADGSYRTIRNNSAERSVAEMAGLYNYKLILEDRSLGIHNFTYVIQVLYDTIESLVPGVDTSKRP